jgi:hypothetical protein
MVGFCASSARGAALFSALLAILLSSCDDGVDRSTPTAPTLGNTPSSPAPPPPPPPPPTTLPVSEAATPGTYERVSPLYPGSPASRFVISGDGTFSLEYGSASGGGFPYPGTYTREGDWYVLDFEGWSTAGPWLASASFGGSCLEVRFNVVMQLTDFEDGRFCR